MKGHSMDIIEAKALFAPCSDLCIEEAFDIMLQEGMTEVEWDEDLDRSFSIYQYFIQK